ncbi:hypothetical protein D4740_07950 [Actinomyces sp. 2119]|uniref:actinodefensin-associated protein B n=1 Tax=Actinomyces sp. 2119 TaxID=2321393 RepID=UPI000E6BC455|nr:actinodefensin-associated protein B [Actinomyces sp. 2119]RJF41978.1 hypothetical protein D4740_07950 [Actinomyces sp. 2119]
MSLTHLKNGGWTLADLHRLSVHEIDEDTGTVLHAAVTGAPGTSSDTTSDSASSSASELLGAAVASGVLVETKDPTASSPTDADTTTHKETQP